MLNVTHQPALGRFSVMVDGLEAYLVYHPAGEGVLDYASTFVPDAVRRQGVGGAIVRHALDYARREGLRVIPTCWFVRRFMDRHPEYWELAAH